MSFLYPFCKANAEGRISDEEYSKHMVELLDRFIKENTVSVSIDREADYSGSGCKEGVRIYSDVVKDTLTFSGSVENYIAQAFTSVTGSQTVEVSYIVNGEIVTPVTINKPFFSDTKRIAVKIPVKGNSLQVVYKYKQKPSRDDDEWGLSFVSSLLISSIRAKVVLPPGKEVTGLHERFSDQSVAFKDCSFTQGEKPALYCAHFSNEPSVPNHLVWKWNVFDGC